MLQITDRIIVGNRKEFPAISLDYLYGPYNSFEEADDFINNFLNENEIETGIPLGLTIAIKSDGDIKEYWWKNEWIQKGGNEDISIALSIINDKLLVNTLVFDGIVEDAEIINNFSADDSTKYAGIYFIKSKKQFAMGVGSIYPNLPPAISEYYHSWKDTNDYPPNDYYDLTKKYISNNLFRCKNDLYYYNGYNMIKINTSSGGTSGTGIIIQ